MVGVLSSKLPMSPPAAFSRFISAASSACSSWIRIFSPVRKKS
jgi:hypothetical protein